MARHAGDPYGRQGFAIGSVPHHFGSVVLDGGGAPGDLDERLTFLRDHPFRERPKVQPFEMRGAEIINGMVEVEAIDIERSLEWWLGWSLVRRGSCWIVRWVVQ
jgi:hypothetical protein